jgi:hypothetical protein
MRNNQPAQSPPQQRQVQVTSGVSLISLHRGTYQFSVREARPGTLEDANGIMVPAVHVGLGPGAALHDVQFLSGLNNGWLYEPQGTVIARIIGSAATLVLTSIRAPGDEPLHIDVDRLSSNREEPSPASAAPSGQSAEEKQEFSKSALPLRIVAHIRNRGDITFEKMAWAGRLGRGHQIEAYSVLPLQTLKPGDIEYKGLTATGFETPWVSDGKPCGTQGMRVPLLGFAVRLKPKVAGRYAVEYSGYYQSGSTIGPKQNGAPCRSDVPNDPLEGIQIRIIDRTAADDEQNKKTSPRPKPRRRGVLRGSEAEHAVSDRPASTKRARNPKKKKAGKRPIGGSQSRRK